MCRGRESDPHSFRERDFKSRVATISPPRHRHVYFNSKDVRNNKTPSLDGGIVDIIVKSSQSKKIGGWCVPGKAFITSSAQFKRKSVNFSMTMVTKANRIGKIPESKHRESVYLNDVTVRSFVLLG